MNSLMMAMAGVFACVSGAIVLHHTSYLRSARQAADCADTQCSSRGADYQPAGMGILTPVVMSLFVFVLGLGIYSQTGRFNDWNQGKLDDNIDYLVAADITKGRQAVEHDPQNEIALLNLAQSYAAGGMYKDAVDTLDKLLAFKGEDAELLGMKATAMYYRDDRAIAPETGIVIARALALYPQELQTRLLLATDAYLNGQYAKAIGHWEILLENQTQAFNRDAINNAILKAQSKLNPQG
ncbi:tetratricopeptide repeat protein [Shewanella sp. GXUN23E]|uniref:tetratricopeptide repeat protein n=1 Tax=Shewanella sp. GXUN23E TaxID=3422498 RepID=UPI003D7DA348